MLLVILCLRLDWWLDGSLLRGLLDGRWRYWWRLIVDDWRRGHLLLHWQWAACLHRSNRHCRSWSSWLVWRQCLWSWLWLGLRPLSWLRLHLFFLHLVDLGFVRSSVAKVLNHWCTLDRCCLFHCLLHLLLLLLVVVLLQSSLGLDSGLLVASRLSLLLVLGWSLCGNTFNFKWQLRLLDPRFEELILIVLVDPVPNE